MPSGLSQPAGRSGSRGRSAVSVTRQLYPAGTRAHTPTRGRPGRRTRARASGAPGILGGVRALYWRQTDNRRRLMATTELTADTIQKTISENDIVLVDFWADWCGPCKRFGPIFEQSSEQHPDVVHAKVDTEAEQQLAAELQITSIPTLMAFREGVLVFNQAGALPAPALEQVVDAVKALDMDDVRAQIAAAGAAQS
ncbi:thioredoxin [Cellulomonas olei]|uniref:thioredoxin n=1 Tax=Cellulomonas sp. P4 TaxID=3142533 RepID=UPI0031B9B4AC